MKIRILSILLAGASDALDGYIARKFNLTSRLGAIVDPVADKFYAAIVMLTLFFEKAIFPYELLLFFSRDLVLLYILYLSRKKLKTTPVISTISGKISTFLQFVFVFFLALDIYIPPIAYFIFIPFAISYFFAYSPSIENLD